MDIEKRLDFFIEREIKGIYSSDIESKLIKKIKEITSVYRKEQAMSERKLKRIIEEIGELLT